MSSAYEWLNLIDVSGPFLAEPVLRQTLPDGLDVLDKGVAPRLRSAYDEWREAVDDRDPRLDQLHAAWIDEALTRVLDYDDSTLLRGDSVPDKVSIDLPEHGTSLHPDMVLVEPARPDTPLMLMMVTEADADLDASVRRDGFVASPKERMVALLRGAGCPLGLVTNGEAWTLVHAPEGAVASHATWYARMFGLERETLRAFASLLGIRRFTGPESDRLPSLFKRSLQHQGDVTEALGDQVAQAIEVLMRALDRADQDRNRELLKDVAPKTLYEAGLTLMMRLVVILSAEERDLLLLGDPIYDAHYAITSMRSQLVAMDPAVLAAREEAWSRLLATFRLVYAGSDHPDLRLPALGGSLFDPDRFPFLEGRKTGSRWLEAPAAPLPIDDRTVLLLLDAIQTFRGRTLSYKALDVEQIGHVYEGLLDQTAGRVEGVTLQLKGSSKARTPLVALADLEKARGAGLDALVTLLVEKTERSEAAIRNVLNTSPEKDDVGRLLTSCRGDAALRDSILPFVRLLADDPWGMPLVHQAGAIVIVKGTDRRESGSHYTPKSLTEKIVEETLTPVVYRGPAEGTDRKDWQLKSPAELLDLKICDPAMGSGAFLVQVCRWLGDRLVEAWAAAETDGRWIDTDGIVHDDAESALDPMVAETEGRTVEARRLIAERCLYGVDMNPLAVELAKLSLWLTTVAKSRPFGFLNHNLRHGDSLLGIDDLDQVIKLEMTPRRSDQLRLFGRSIGKAVEDAMRLRRELRAHPVRDIEDVKAMARLDAESRRKLELPILITDAFVGCVLVETKGRALEEGLTTIAALADAAAGGQQDARDALIRMAKRDLAKDEPYQRSREPFHWPLEFPEVFGRKNGGFDAFVGNPPFVGGKRISTVSGPAYNVWLVNSHHGSSRNADLVAHFFRRCWSNLRQGGALGLLATNSIAEGDTRQSGLEWMVHDGASIYAAYPSEPWPGQAAVVTSRIHLRRGDWGGERFLSGEPVKEISPFLTSGQEWSPIKLKRNNELAFIGSFVNGMGFVLAQDNAGKMLDADPKNADVIFPYLNGQDLNSDPMQKPSRFVINFWDWPEEKAKEYELPYEWLLQNVYPERLEKSRQKSYQNIMSSWWLHWNARPTLYHAIGRGHHFEKHPGGWDAEARPRTRVLAVTRVSKTLAFSFVSPDFVYSDATVVFASEQSSTFAVLQSNIHAVFAWQHASRLKNDLRYSPTDALEPFALPSGVYLNSLQSLGSELDETRRNLMISQNYGLTRLFGEMHSSESMLEGIEQMRELHREIDERLADAYGWGDLELCHDFHTVPYLPENDRVRFTISEDARREILHRLAELNRERYQEEVEQGLHGDVKPVNKPRPSKPKKTSPKTAELSMGLDLPEPPQPSSNDKKHALLTFLRSRPGRHGRGNLFGVRRMTITEFSSAMEELVSEELVVRDGTAPNETYMISERGKNG
jgi:hypothetical protein